MILHKHSLVSMALAACTAAAMAQDAAPAPQPGEEVEDSIVITGERRDPERIRIMLDFVHGLGDPVSRDFGFARLEHPACFRVHNTATDIAGFLQQRMAANVESIGLESASADCRPNIDIIMTDDGNTTATRMVETRRSLFKPFGNAEGTTQDSHALSAFRKSGAAVRWWQITVPVDRVGNPVVPSPNPGEPPNIMATNSHLSSGMRDTLLGTIIIVDVSKLGEATWDQLADYLTIVSLVQVDPKASMAGFDSILNLFSGNAAAPALTAWDKAYISALYSMNLYMLPHVQKGQLANQLMRNLDKAAGLR